MAVGEMSRAAFTRFLQRRSATPLRSAAMAPSPSSAWTGGTWASCSTAGEAVFSELKNLCVWNKTNGGMGTFYRSKHELIFVFKVGTAPHTNSFGLGDTGRYRTNVWDYAGINTMRQVADELAMHPTVKPVALVADAIRDCSKRGEIVLDRFGGSGTTLIAAEKTGRRLALIEFDPLYCDTIVRRWETFTGKQAKLRPSGKSSNTWRRSGLRLRSLLRRRSWHEREHREELLGLTTKSAMADLRSTAASAKASPATRGAGAPGTRPCRRRFAKPCGARWL